MPFGMKKLLILLCLPILSFICLGLFGITEASFKTGTKYALVINTWNDFPKEEAPDVDAFPAQALQAYFVLKDRGYTDDHIYLMVYHSNDSFVDIDGDAVDDLPKAIIDAENELVTQYNLEIALNDLSHTVGKHDELLVYLVGHGQLDGNSSALSFEKGGSVTKQQFGVWLDEIYCERMVILLDFCFSGNFAESLVEPGRTIVSSAEGNKVCWDYWDWSPHLNDSNKAIFGDSGSAFFHPFWNKLSEGTPLQEAYEYGKEQCFRWGFIDTESKNITQSQNPQMYVKERTLLENFVFFFPGGFSGFWLTLMIVTSLEGIIVIATIATLGSPPQ